MLLCDKLEQDSLADCTSLLWDCCGCMFFSSVASTKYVASDLRIFQINPCCLECSIALFSKFYLSSLVHVVTVSHGCVFCEFL